MVRAYLARADRLAHLGAWSYLDRAGALAAARALEARPAAGLPLYGLPVAIKDVVAVRGLPWEAGSAVLAGQRAREDATVVRRLRAAGAVVLGKARTHEFAIGEPVPPGPGGPGTGVHPWTPAYAPGGSSSGSAVAAAAGLCALALGTDTGGSVRAPAAACGVVGYVPRRLGGMPAGVVPLVPSMDRLGWLARTVADVALAERLERPDLPPPRPRLPRRAAVLPDDWRSLCDQEVLERYEVVERDLRAEGVELVAVPLGSPAELGKIWRAHAWETARAHRRRGWWPAHAAAYGPGAGAFVRAGDALPDAAYRAARRRREQWAAAVERQLAGFDVLLAPTTPFPALPASGAPNERVFAWYAFVLPWNLSGHAALSLPCGYAADGVPLGLQVVAPSGREGMLLAVARGLERRYAPPVRDAAEGSAPA